MHPGIAPSDQLDTIIRQSLTSLFADVSGSSWKGRERELISLYVHGHLLRFCTGSGILSDLTQVGIEVAVPQHRDWGDRPKEDVCKDVVIWPKPKMTCWDENGEPKQYPLSVLEFKTINEVKTERPKDKKSQHETEDIPWLRLTSERVPGFIGYAVFACLKRGAMSLRCTRTSGGQVRRDWLALP